MESLIFLAILASRPSLISRSSRRTRITCKSVGFSDSGLETGETQQPQDANHIDE